MTTLETDISFQFSSSQFNLSKLNVQNTITCSNNEYNVIYNPPNYRIILQDVCLNNINLLEHSKRSLNLVSQS